MLASITGIRPTNCDVLVGGKEHCPECGMHHLRPGYCAALDSLSDWPNTRLGKAWLAKHPRPDSPVVDVTLTSENVPVSKLDVPDNVPDNVDVPDNVEIVPVRDCDVCGLGFEAKRSDARYCSDACRKRAQRS